MKKQELPLEIKEVRVVAKYHPEYDWLKEDKPDWYPFLLERKVIARSGSKKYHICSLYEDHGELFIDRDFGWSKGLSHRTITPDMLKGKFNPLESTLYSCPDNKLDLMNAILRKERLRLLNYSQED